MPSTPKKNGVHHHQPRRPLCARSQGQPAHPSPTPATQARHGDPTNGSATGKKTTDASSAATSPGSIWIRASAPFPARASSSGSPASGLKGKALRSKAKPASSSPASSEKERSAARLAQAIRGHWSVENREPLEARHQPMEGRRLASSQESQRRPGPRPIREEPSCAFMTPKHSRVSTPASITTAPNPTPHCASSKLPRPKSINQRLSGYASFPPCRR